MRTQLDFSIIVDTFEDSFGCTVSSRRLVMRLNGEKVRGVKRLALQADDNGTSPVVAVVFNKKYLRLTPHPSPKELLQNAVIGLESFCISEE